MNKRFTAVAAAWLLIAPMFAHAQSVAAGKSTDTSYNAEAARYKGYNSTGYSYKSYQRSYPPDPAYTPEAMREQAYRDSVNKANITADMLADGIITNGASFTFKLSNTVFIVNGIQQNNAVFARYKQKYVQPVKEGEWSWTCTVNLPAEQQH